MTANLRGTMATPAAAAKLLGVRVEQIDAMLSAGWVKAWRKSGRLHVDLGEVARAFDDGSEHEDVYELVGKDRTESAGMKNGPTGRFQAPGRA